MKNILFLALILLTSLTSCDSNDDDFKFASEDNLTSIAIETEDADGNYVTSIDIYAYNESTWETYGDNPDFADFNTTTGDEGLATFITLTTDDTFNEANNYYQTYVFSAHYTLDNSNKIKTRTVSFNIGDDKSITIVLD